MILSSASLVIRSYQILAVRGKGAAHVSVVGAPLRHATMSAVWSLTVGKRTSRGQAISVAFGPTRTLALAERLSVRGDRCAKQKLHVPSEYASCWRLPDVVAMRNARYSRKREKGG